MKSVGQNFPDESEAVLLIGFLTDLRGYLAAGQWLAPDMCCYCFWSRRFRRWRRFFFVGGFCPTDFTDIHRFFMESLVNLFVSLRGYLQRPDRSPPWKSVSNRRSRKSPNKFREIRWIKIPWEKNLRHLRNLRDKKKRPKKNLCKSVESVGLLN